MLDLNVITHLFKTSPEPTLVLYPDAPLFTVAYAIPSWLNISQAKAGDLVGKSVFKIMGEQTQYTSPIENSPLQDALLKSLYSKSPGTYGNCYSYPITDAQDHVLFVILNIKETIQGNDRNRQIDRLVLNPHTGLPAEGLNAFCAFSEFSTIIMSKYY